MSRHLAPLLWLDLETTGLEPDAQIIEVAACITEPDAPFNRLDGGEFRSLVTPEPPFTVGDFVVNMHTVNGLWAEIARSPARPVADVERELVAYIGRTVAGSKVTLAGSGVARFDFDKLRQFMPRVAGRLTYYTFDTGVIRRWFQACGHAVPDDEGGHRAWGDVELALEQARQFAARSAGAANYICATCFRRVEGPMVAVAGTSRVIHYPECPEVEPSDG